MKLEEFTDTHRDILKSWFDKHNESNRFIKYYAQPEDWLSLVNGMQRIAYAGMVKGKMVGFADLELDNENGASFAFGINPLLRGQGFGLKLVQKIEQVAKERGVTTLYAGVEHENIACRKVLEKANYSTTPSEDGLIGYIKAL